METISPTEIESIVNEVVSQLHHGGGNLSPNTVDAAGGGDGVFQSMDAAVAAARQGFNELQECTLVTRIRIIETIRESLRGRAEELARMAIDETGLGRYEDKVVKNLLVINSTPGPEFLRPEVSTNDRGLILHEYTAWGVIGSITPTTNPSETIINNGISFISAGNTGVFNPHPRAKNISSHTVRLINRASQAAGGPGNLLTSVATPTIESANALMHHAGIDLVVVTGGPAVVKAAFASGKKVICGGPGNPPSVVDETAKIEVAGRQIVAGHSLDNNIICTDEKEVVVVNKVADQLIESMRASGAYLISRDQCDRLLGIVFKDTGTPGKCGGHSNPDYVGQNAQKLLAEIGVKVGDDVRCAIADVPNDHPLVWTEQLMPILAITRVPDVQTAISFAVKVEQGCKHTASMHSMNIENLSTMARAFQGSIFVKNGPNYAGLGEAGPGFTSFTIASPTGDGLTTCRTFSRRRHCAVVDNFRIV